MKLSERTWQQLEILKRRLELVCDEFVHEHTVLAACQYWLQEIKSEQSEGEARVLVKRDGVEDDPNDYLFQIVTMELLEGSESYRSLYLNVSGAALCVERKFSKTGDALTIFRSSECALRRLKYEDPVRLHQLAFMAGDMAGFHSSLDKLEQKLGEKDPFRNNRVKFFRVLSGYALGEISGRAPFKKKIKTTREISTEKPQSTTERQVHDVRNQRFDKLTGVPFSERDDFADKLSYLAPDKRYALSSPLASSRLQQGRYNRQKSKRAILNEQVAALHRSHLSSDVIKSLVAECMGHIESNTDNQIHACFLILSLILGRSVSTLLNLPDYDEPERAALHKSGWVCLGETIYFTDTLIIPRRSIPDTIDDEVAETLFDRRETSALFLPVPAELQEPMWTYLKDRREDVQSDHPIEKADIYEFLKSLDCYRGSGLTLDKLSIHLQLELKHEGVDPVVICHLAGTLPRRTPSVYYTQIQLETVHREFSSYVQKYGLTTLPLFSPDHALGSALVPKERVLAEFFETMRRKIDALKPTKHEPPTAAYHNLLMLYTYQILTLASGHRPVKSPFGFLSDFDLVTGGVWICDKEVQENHGSRVIQLCKTALEQLKNYVGHLQRIARSRVTYDLVLKNAAEGALTASTPLLFWRSDTETPPLTPANLQKYGADLMSEHGINQMPQNWQRHVGRTELTINLFHETTNAYLGHGNLGFGPMSAISGYCFPDTFQATGWVQKLLERLKIQPTTSVADLSTVNVFKKRKKNQYFGRHARKLVRKKALTNALERLMAYDVVKHFTPKYITSVEEYEEQLPLVEEAIQNVAKKEYILYYFRRQLQKEAQKIRRTHNLNVSLPTMPSKVIFEATNRGESWFHFARSIHDWNTEFEANLNQLSRNSVEPIEQIIGLVAYSAITRGGLIDPHMIMALINKLKRKDIELNCVGSFAYIDLKVSAEDSFYNLGVGDKQFVSRRWFVDEVSLALIRRYLLKRLDKVTVPGGVFKLIENALFPLQNDTPIKNLQQLTQSALWGAETQYGLKLSEMMQSITSGDVQTFSQSEESFLAIFRQPKVKGKVTARLDVGYQSRQLPKSVSEMSGFFDDILVPALQSDVDHLKIGSTRVKRNLLNILNRYDLPPAAKLFVEWLYEHNKRNKPSTLSRYTSTLGVPWFLEIASRDLDILDPESLQTFYSDLVEYHSSESERAYMHGRLADLHAFGMRHPNYNLPPLSDLELGGLKRLTFVRTSLLSAHQVRTVIKLMQRYIRTDTETKKLEVMINLAFRAGLRLSELCKLSIRDINSCNPAMITIRSNQYADNKSAAAYRHLNLRTFLSAAEFSEYVDYVNVRRMHVKGTAPVFNFGSSNLPVSGAKLSRMFSEAVKLVTGDDGAVFHSLRHSCFSYLHATFEQEYEVARLVSGFDATELKAIRYELLGHVDNRQGQYYTLAALAGHSTPKTTMGSYCHLSDLILFQKLKHVALPLPSEKLAQIAGLQAAKLDGLDVDDRYNYMVGRMSSMAKVHPYLPAHQIVPTVFGKVDEPKFPRVNFHLVHQMLTMMDQGFSEEALALRISLPLPRIQKWVLKARQLLSLETKQGNSRLRSKQVKRLMLGLSRVEDMKELQSVLEHVHHKYDDQGPQPLIEWAENVLLSCYSEARCYRCHLPAEASDIVTFLQPTIPATRWHVDLEVKEKKGHAKTLKDWRKSLPSGVKVKLKVNPQGTDGLGKLYLHSKKSGKTSLPKVVAYVISITMI